MTTSTGGRGARERILAAAAELFYAHGINATGMAELTGVAHVSKRTFYQHFPSKEAVVEEYLRQFDARRSLARETVLDDESLPPRQRLLALFAPPPRGAMLRGCPFHNAAVEVPDPGAEARAIVARHKKAFTRRIAKVAAEAGIERPDVLARRLAILFDGALAQAGNLDSARPFTDARAVAELLLGPE